MSPPPDEPAATLPTPPALATTPLDAWHRRLGARMVPFAGYAMPVQYDFAGEMAARCRGGVLGEHLHCRAQAALFDVSHMGQAWITGAGADAVLETLVVGDIAGLREGRQRYSLLTNDQGGILDDLMIARAAPGADGTQRLFLVVNAANKEADFAHIAAHLPPGVTLTPLPARALVAVQGPAAAAILGALDPATAALPFLGFATARLAGIDCLISRSGYTGEDGFEISCPAEQAEALADALLGFSALIPAGLGARDSLRLEAGLCLHGNDIDPATNPIEAGLTWTIGKRRRMAADFPGAGPILAALAEGPARLRVGIRPEGRAPARAGTAILNEAGETVGTITSGGFSPSLSAPIAMGYVRRDAAGDGTKLWLSVRGQRLPAQVVPMPFVPHRYIR
ncbi:MAG: glycine cleavage system aminomethyltransferase GcvT [Rhodospirillales bacterium]|nr:glycine cleavage system aminomethyltransferase GcvT [Rhodospirillales bacterium]